MKEVAIAATRRPSVDVLTRESQSLQGPMGAVAWGVLEMFRRGGMEPARIDTIHAEMKKYFTVPSNEECNSILKVIEERLKSEKQDASQDQWY